MPARPGDALAFLSAGLGCLSREQLEEIGVPKLLKAAASAADNATGAQAQAARTDRVRRTATLLDAGALAAGDLDHETVLGALEACDASVAGVAAVLRVAVSVIAAAPPDAAVRAANSGQGWEAAEHAAKAAGAEARKRLREEAAAAPAPGPRTVEATPPQQACKLWVRYRLADEIRTVCVGDEEAVQLGPA